MTKSAFSIAKTAFSAGGRLQKTAKVGLLSALRVAKGEPLNAYLLRDAFEQMGTTYIKLGQFIASTPSLFPKDYVLAFADCLDNTSPIRFELIKAVLDEQLAHMGGSLAFASIDPVPLASASIAQVHKATLKSGETVAIKVQKPDVATIIHTDLSVLHASLWTLEKLVPNLSMASLAPIISEIKERMLAETDFVQEANHLANFRQFLLDKHIHNVRVPEVYTDYSSQKVLTMSFFEGVSLIDEQALSQISDPAAVMGTVLDTWFMSLLATGEFHADLHAGNLMLLKDGTIGFLDFGLVGVIEPASLQACMHLVHALGRSDYEAMAEAMATIKMTKSSVDIASLAHDLKRLLGQSGATDSQARAQELNALMANLVEIGKKHGIHFPRDFALLTKQFLYFDRFMQTLAPSMDLFDNRLGALTPSV